ncbi:uncharacterized protein [Dysidea avara]|uniref:uncharacterized protein isoform X1 n=1 Tax=Dysidea avara TaxID=196820 RepID=UPI0033270C04
MCDVNSCEEFSTIFRRVFASHVFPAEIVEQFGKMFTVEETTTVRWGQLVDYTLSRLMLSVERHSASLCLREEVSGELSTILASALSFLVEEVSCAEYCMEENCGLQQLSEATPPKLATYIRATQLRSPPLPQCWT